MNDDLSGPRGVQQFLPASYRVLVSDRAGNQERLAFVYDSTRVEQLEKVGEIAYAPADAKNVKLPGIQQTFEGFDRNSRNIIALGDLNLPKAAPGDPIFDALTKRGLRLPTHSTQLGSSIAKDKHYDQVAFFPPGESEDALIRASAVFDWDGALFKSLWEDRGAKAFFEYCRY